jgi:hypothetical protein
MQKEFLDPFEGKKNVMEGQMLKSWNKLRSEC